MRVMHWREKADVFCGFTLLPSVLDTQIATIDKVKVDSGHPKYPCAPPNPFRVNSAHHWTASVTPGLLPLHVDKTWTMPFDTWQVCGFGHTLDDAVAPGPIIYCTDRRI